MGILDSSFQCDKNLNFGGGFFVGSPPPPMSAGLQFAMAFHRKALLALWSTNSKVYFIREIYLDPDLSFIHINKRWLHLSQLSKM